MTVLATGRARAENDVVEWFPGVVNTRLDFTSAQAAEIRLLLGQRLRADRDEQKRLRGRLRGRLRSLGFRISDFEVGLTPAGFDALVLRGVVSVSDAAPRTHAVARVLSPPGAPPAPAAAHPAPPMGDVLLVQNALSTSPWTFEEAVAMCPNVPGLYAVYARGLTEADRAGVWDQLGLGPKIDLRPLYVGKAEDSLAGRDLRGHFTGKSGSSTLRRSLAALLRERLDLSACPRNPHRPGDFASYGLEASSEVRLSAWMARSLMLAVWPRGKYDGALVSIEEAVIRLWQPPLNLTHVATSWTALVKARRARMAEDARAKAILALGPEHPPR